MKACVAALNQIFMSSARYGVEEDVLISELQQLGLPKENAVALGKVYNENLTTFTEDLAKRTLRSEFSCLNRRFLSRLFAFSGFRLVHQCIDRLLEIFIDRCFKIKMSNER